MYVYKAIITNVVDGDTVDARVDLGFSVFVEWRFRVGGLDTPETWRPSCEAERVHGHEAKDRALELLLNEEVLLKSSKDVGIYGRYTASIILEDNVDYATLMIDEGFQKRKDYQRKEL